MKFIIGKESDSRFQEEAEIKSLDELLTFVNEHHGDVRIVKKNKRYKLIICDVTFDDL